MFQFFKVLCFLFFALSFFGCADIPDDLRDEADKMSKKCESIFNPDTHFCYDGDVFSRCNGMKYNPTTHICQGSVANPARCSGKQYNPLEQDCCVSSVFDLADQRCQGSVVETRCGTGNNYHNPATQFCNGNDVLNKCNGNDYNPANQRCESNVIETQCGSVWYNPVTEYCSNGTKKLYGFVTHGGQTYKTVEIGEQIWLAENLNFAAAGSVCYGNLESNCDIYGRLYNWSTAMNGAASSSANPSGIQGVCPPGWHLPTDAEWATLTNFVGTNAGKKLKAVDTWFYNATHVGTDDFGFSALPGGNGWNGSFSSVGSGGVWWSATEDGASLAWYRVMGSNFSDVGRGNDDKSSLFSVRCVKD
ncbi:MAG: fibrobacter succinogenes major paralogous domain-containing protein [Fibromonadaceae bacterium]|jgi:uncharacterized protein (TIGR02145 family)|nr:fibrobacter succinogenes major paralogous domain-containing protein [Fibromonadaceae bacterium]